VYDLLELTLLFSFFDIQEGYDIWELYRVSVEEIIKTTIIGVLAITCAALLLIPHWSAALVVFPLVVLLYIDLMGFVQICGVRINPISYIGLVVSVLPPFNGNCFGLDLPSHIFLILCVFS
jgi:multidrug efflux pump subunit AcrB